jgi:hypothetical protein
MRTWKEAYNLPNYDCSDDGLIRRKDTGRILAPAKTGSGYLFFCPSHHGKITRASVHRVVAATFIGPCPKGLEVNHKNGNRLDNRAQNLEYVTRSENMRHAHTFSTRKHTSLRGNKVRNAKLSETKVRAIRKLLLAGKTQTELANEFGVVKQVIWSIAHNKWWKWVK